VSKRVEVGSLMEQHGAITSLEFFGQSHMLSGSADNSICIWRTADWNCLHILGGHKCVILALEGGGRLDVFG
jgi:protein MAK11